jgi:hypothetical protein
MKILNITVRIEKKTGKPAIFYRNSVKYTGNALACYTREEQHSDACLAYYRQNTRPSASIVEREACADLVIHYARICRKYDGQELQLNARLRDN